MLLVPIYFACSNPLFFSHSDIIFYLHTTLLAPLQSDMLALILSNLLALLLSSLFLSIILHSASIVSDYYPQLCLICSILSVSSLLISDFFAHDPL